MQAKRSGRAVKRDSDSWRPNSSRSAKVRTGDKRKAAQSSSAAEPSRVEISIKPIKAPEHPRRDFRAYRNRKTVPMREFGLPAKVLAVLAILYLLTAINIIVELFK